MKNLLLAVSVLALVFCVGCGVTENTATEEDRQIVEMNVQIARKQDAAGKLITACIGGDTANATSALGELDQLNKDALANNLQLQKNFGPPKNPVAYTPANAAKVRQDSDAIHTKKGFWAWLGGAFLTGAGLLIGLARSPLARFVPGIGTVATALDTTFTAVETWMQSKKEAGQGAVADDLAKVLELAHADKNIGNFVDAKLDAVKKKLGIDVVSLAKAAPADEPVTMAKVADELDPGATKTQ